VTKPLTSYTATLDAKQAAALRVAVDSRSYRFYDVPYAEFGAEGPEVRVVFYKSGKAVVQGKGTREFVEFVLEPEVLGEASLGYEAVKNPDYYTPRIGVDESGKGDFFGPLCIAGVYVNQEVIDAWKDSGIQDSKRIGSDRRIGELAKLIRGTQGCVCDVVAVGNEAYNRMHAKLGSVNSILAWGHARVIENLLAREAELRPPPVKAISDQFASSKRTVEKALMGRGQTLELVQRHKAESDVAVAAASILARNEFVSRLSTMGREIGIALKKGASKEVEKAGSALVSRLGPEALNRFAKLHFQTTGRVLAGAGA
jgi:ribonuclease HIII